MRMIPAEWWAEFKIFEDRDGSYSWQLQAASGRIIARFGPRLRKQVLMRAGRELAARKRGPDHGVRPHHSRARISILAVFRASWRRDSRSVGISQLLTD